MNLASCGDGLCSRKLKSGHKITELWFLLAVG